MKKTSTIPLVIALAIPVLMILLVAASIYIPSFFVQGPTQDFLYTYDDYYLREYISCEGNTYPYGPIYEIENHRVVKREYIIPEQCKKQIPLNVRMGQLFFYDVAEAKAREITLEEAQTLSIDTSQTSRDGFTIQRGSGPDGLFPFLFGGSNDYNAIYISKEGYHKKLNLTASQRYDTYNFQLLGWIE